MNTELISFDDLMSGNRRRSMVLQILGLGSVTITELSGKESAKVREESKSVPLDDSEANEKFIARTVYRFLRGEYPANDSEIDVLREKLSSAVLVDIYKQGLAFNLASADSREEIEKN